MIYNLDNMAAFIAFTDKAHEGQVDKGGKPYTDHLKRVSGIFNMLAAKLPAGMMTHEQKIRGTFVAYGHDLIEDTDVTEDTLRDKGFDEEFIADLKALSRVDPKPQYMQWIQEIADRGVLTQILVKMADNRDNRDPDRIAQLPVEEQGISKRYDRAYDILKPALDRLIEEYNGRLTATHSA